MARATNGLGQFRGRVGSVVFRVSQGQQIASAYQPSVRNPKSNLQTAQRNKMYLASQLSKLVPREDLIGLVPNGSARDRRSVFIKNILDRSTSSLNDGVFTTSIYYGSVAFSKGNIYDGVSVTTNNQTGGGSNIVITIDKVKVSEEQFNRLAIKLIQLDVFNNLATSYKSSWLYLGVYNTESTSSFDITIPVTSSSNIATYLYIIPVEVKDGVRYSEEKKTLVQTDFNDGELLIQGEYAINNAVLNWYGSIGVGKLGGSGDVIPPSTGGNEVVNPDGPNFPNLG